MERQTKWRNSGHAVGMSARVPIVWPGLLLTIATSPMRLCNHDLTPSRPRLPSLTLLRRSNPICGMSDPETSEIIALQSNLIRRLGEVGIEDRTRDNLARELAHVAVLGRSFAEHTLPLFLSMGTDHKDLLHQVVISMKRDLDELGDAIHDIEIDFPDLIGAFEARNG